MVAQNQFTIENNAENVAVFDTDNPDSFMSFLKYNSAYFEYNNTKGINEEVFQLLTSKERSSIFGSIGSEGTIPIIITDPESPNFGENLIRFDDNGFKAYLYEAPDTLWTDFEDVSKITFDYYIGDGSVWDRIETVKIWKEYKVGLYEVLSLEGQTLFKFDGFSRMYSLEVGVNEKLTNASDSLSFWNFMRDWSLAELRKEGTKIERSKELTMNFFPSRGFQYGFYHSALGSSQLNYRPRFGGYWHYSYKSENYTTGSQPFSIDFTDEVYEDPTALDTVYKLFDKVYMKMMVSTLPLINMDVNSPEFGENLIEMNAAGETKLIYEDPWPEYFWLDYSDAKIIVAQTFYNDDNGISKPYITDLFFTKVINEESQAISHLCYSDALQKYFEGYDIPKLQDFEWHQIFKAASKDIESHSIGRF
jgi:hypothetical protein